MLSIAILMISYPCIYKCSHKFWFQSPSHHYQYYLQVFETVSWHKLQCCYSAKALQNWVGARGVIYFCKVDHSKISRKFSRKWLGLNNLCKILQHYVNKKIYFRNGLWKVSSNTWLGIMFIISLFSKYVLAIVDIIYNQSLCPK